MVAERLELLEFADALTVIVPLFEPDDGLTVHQLELLVTVHDIFEEMLNELLLLE